MSVVNRPFAGNWSPDILNFKRRFTTWTPDAIVLFNGDTKLPGCNECKNKIDFQAFITSVNCSAGTEASPSSADISLSIPSHYGDSIFKDGEFLFQTGVEINIYYRGFFEISGLHPEGETVSENIGGVQADFNLNEVEMRPYYPVFHGVVTSISYSFSGGFYSASLSCSNILHFWNNQKVVTSAAYMASKPSASKGSTRFDGHIYTNMTPHQIIYDLYRDSAGSADGVSWTFSKKSNLNGTTQLEGRQESLYSLSLLYWNQRFAQGAYTLRMYGASGAVYTGLQTTYLGNKIASSKNLKKVSAKQQKQKAPNETDPSSVIKLTERDDLKRINRQPDGDLLPDLVGSKNGVAVADQKAFITDISAIGSFELFDTQYETKLGIAGTVAEKAGYEFYQDVDGSLVFKPPFYNLDTSSSRIYRIENEDIVDISFEHQEPEYTYAICKGGLFRNTAGLGMEGTWGNKSTYVDYRLVAKYGWKALEFDTTFFNNKTSAYYAAVVELEKKNVNTNGCSLTIPLRPELRPGYPVYIAYIDCFYYVTSISHSFSFGGDCTTSLTLTARRKKFYAPGRSDKNGIDGIDLSNPALPPKPLVMKDIRGHYKTVGFPNVVMALDPTRVNPNHTYYRYDYHEGLSSSNGAVRLKFKNALILQGYTLGFLKLSKDGSSDINSDGFFNGPWELTFGNGEKKLLGVDKNKVQARVDKKTRVSFQEVSGTKALRDLATQRDTKQNKALKGKNRKDFGENDKKIRDEYYQQRSELKNSLSEGGQASVLDLIDLIENSNPAGGQSQNPDGDDSETKKNTLNTVNILKLLDDKKASFDPNLPGYYRYYSSSHPIPDQQAPLEIIVDEDGNLKDLAPSRLDAVSPSVFKNAPSGLVADEVVVEEGKVKQGFKTKTKYYKDEPEITATKDILHLSFQYHGMSRKRNVRSNNLKRKRNKKYFESQIKKAVKKGVANAFKKGDTISSETLIASVFNNSTKSQVKGSQLQRGQVRRKGETNEISGPVQKKEKGGIISQTVTGLVFALMHDYGSTFTGNLSEDQYRTKVDEISSDLSNLFYTKISGSKGITGSSVVGSKTVFDGYVSPIFPVSDNNGYEVFGAYQYGRGLDIVPNAEFDSLLKRDPTTLLTNKESDELLDNIKAGNKKAYTNTAKSVYQRLKGEGVLPDVYFRLIGEDLPKDEEGIVGGIANALETADRGKQVVANSPIRLRDLRPLLNKGNACDCRAENSDLQMILAEEFLRVTDGNEEESAIVEAQRSVIEGKVKDWSDRQASLQGEIDISQSALPTNVLERLSAGLDDLQNLSNLPLPEPPKN